jgi:hypothetical protein
MLVFVDVRVVSSRKLIWYLAIARIAMVPLNDEGYDEMASPPHVRLRTGTIGSEDFNEKGANLRIDMDTDQKKSIKANMFSCKCLVLNHCVACELS